MEDTKLNLHVNENLEFGKHTFVLKTNLNAKAWDETANTIDITSVQLNNEGTPKNLNVKKLVAKAYPTISSKSILRWSYLNNLKS